MSSSLKSQASESWKRETSVSIKSPAGQQLPHTNTLHIVCNLKSEVQSRKALNVPKDTKH